MLLFSSFDVRSIVLPLRSNSALTAANSSSRSWSCLYVTIIWVGSPRNKLRGGSRLGDGAPEVDLDYVFTGTEGGLLNVNFLRDRG